MSDLDELRKRAAWYRDFAERAGNPWIWAARLKTADELEAEAARAESKPTLELVGQPNARNPSQVV
jgi:hypothetical protein